MRREEKGKRWEGRRKGKEGGKKRREGRREEGRKKEKRERERKKKNELARVWLLHLLAILARKRPTV